MSDRLKLAFEQAAKLPEAEQDSFGELFLAMLEDEREWQRQFDGSQDALAKLAAEARAEHAAGKTRPLEDLLK